MNQVGYFNETSTSLVEFDELHNFIDFALTYLKLEKVLFNIILVNNEAIQKINLEYRGLDKPTDVISFALEDYTDISYDEGRLLGDIYISLEKAIEQATDYKHSLKRELSFLALHGLLHLLGYDHMTDSDEEEMFEKQEMILNEAGITR